MSFLDAVKICLRKYAEGNGRASRAEYWYFVLFILLVQIAFRVLYPPLAYVFDLAVFLPNIGVGIRRLHDTDRAGLWLLISLIPLVGWIVLVIWFSQKSDPGENRFGPPPLPRRAEGL